MMSELTVKLTKTINAPVEKLFDAWLDPAMLSQFILPMPGMPQPEVKNEAREGGRFSIIMHVGDDQVPHTGEYLTINRPHKLVFSWQSPFSIDGSEVTLNFTEVDSNTTDIELIHMRFPDEESRSNHEGGWRNILDMLDRLST